MAKVLFNVDTISRDGYHLKGTTANIDDDYAKELVKLTGVEIIEEPKKKRTKKKKDDDI